MYIEKQVNRIKTRLNLMQLIREYPDDSTLKAVFDLVCCRLDADNPFQNIQVNTQELCNVDITLLTNDYCIIARWYDMLLCSKVDVVNNSLLAYNYYILAYKDNDDYKLALRAFTLVKLRKGLYSQSMNEICQDADYSLYNVKLPRQFKSLLSVIVSFRGKEQLQLEFGDYVQLVLDDAKNQSDFDNAIICVDILELLGVISASETKIQRSLLLESDADNILSTARENTLYPAVLQKYSSALKEISSLPDTGPDRERISNKIINEQLNTSEAMSYFGVKSKIDRWKIYEEMVTIFSIDSPVSAFGAIINFPISPKEIVYKLRDESKQNHSMLYQSFSRSVWCNEKGAVVNIKDGDEAIDESIRQVGHFLTSEYLFILIWIFNSAGDCDIELKVIERFLRLHKSRFIPKDRTPLYVQGLYAGFKGDYSLAAHILLPQIENSFRHIAQQHGIITTQLDKDIQHENTMGGVLDKIKDKTDPDLWIDLKSFLIDGEGFRNQALHGLIPLQKLERNGIYLWWLCLKMIDKTDSYFGFEEV